MKIFIAGPYGNHNPEDVIAENVRKADEAARFLVARGHRVFCPHTMMRGWENDPTVNSSRYLPLDSAFIIDWAEAIYRLPGISPGADNEVKLAERLGLPVYYHLHDIPEPEPDE